MILPSTTDPGPIMIFGVVLLASFVLLMAVFRSLLVPVKAVIMNMLSISAAYGIVVAIFQWGWFWEYYLDGEHIIALITVLLATWFLHRAVNIIGYKMGKKEVPW